MILNEEQVQRAAAAIEEIAARPHVLRVYLRGLIISVIEEPELFRGVLLEHLTEAPPSEPTCSVCGGPVKYAICAVHRYGDHKSPVMSEEGA